MLGSTGVKDTSGDLDVAIDKEKVDKNELVSILQAWVVKNYPKEDPKHWKINKREGNRGRSRGVQGLVRSHFSAHHFCHCRRAAPRISKHCPQKEGAKAGPR